MMKSLLYIILTIFYSLCVHATSNSCTSFYQSEELLKQINHLEKSYALKPVWDDYNIADKSIVFTNVKSFPRCAVIYNNGKIVKKIRLMNDLVLANGVYAFHLPIYSPNLELKKTLESLKIKYSLIISLNDWSWFPDYLLPLIGGKELITNVMHHEGFHLYQQVIPDIDSSSTTSWPSWSRSGATDRDEIPKICYDDSRVKQIYKKELQALISANQLLFNYKKRELAIEAAKEFISNREKRYSIVKSIQVPTSDGTKASCLLAEAEWEMTEGTAHYVGAVIPFKLNTTSSYQYIEFARANLDYAVFGSFGMLELFLLEGLFPNDFSNMTKGLSSSTTWKESLYTLFKRKVNVL